MGHSSQKSALADCFYRPSGIATKIDIDVGKL